MKKIELWNAMRARTAVEFSQRSKRRKVGGPDLFREGESEVGDKANIRRVRTKESVKGMVKDEKKNNSLEGRRGQGN